MIIFFFNFPLILFSKMGDQVPNLETFLDIRSPTLESDVLALVAKIRPGLIYLFPISDF
jgi:hypothetical protein